MMILFLIGLGITLIMTSPLWMDSISIYIDTHNRNSSYKKKALAAYKLTLLSDNLLEISNFIKNNSENLSEKQVDSLVSRYAELKLDHELKTKDTALKRRIALLEEEEVIEELTKPMKRRK